jgi:hypothetical protein
LQKNAIPYRGDQHRKLSDLYSMLGRPIGGGLSPSSAYNMGFEQMGPGGVGTGYQGYGAESFTNYYDPTLPSGAGDLGIQGYGGYEGPGYSITDPMGQSQPESPLGGGYMSEDVGNFPYLPGTGGAGIGGTGMGYNPGDYIDAPTPISGGGSYTGPSAPYSELYAERKDVRCPPGDPFCK